MSFWLAAATIPVVTAVLLFRPLLRKGGPWLGLGLALLLLLPVTTLLLYQGVGTPTAIDPPRPPQDMAQGAGQDADIEDLLAQLEARMAAQPDDLEGWLLLGRSYRSLQRHNEALTAFRRARELAPEEPVVADVLARAGAAESLDERECVNRCLAYGRQAYRQRRISSEASIGKLLFQNGYKLMANRGLVDADGENTAARRARESQAFRELAFRLERVRILAQPT